MKKFEGILLCSDLDGTLLCDDGSISKENIKAIEHFKSEGGLFTFITGRPPMIAVDIYNTVKPNAPIGCYNGGGIYDFTQQKLLWSMSLPEDFKELLAVVEENMPDIGFQLNTEKAIYFCKDNPAMERFRDITGIPNLYCDYKTTPEQIIKVVFGHLDSDRISQLSDLLNSHPKASQFDFIRSEYTLYEILPKNVSKGAVLNKMAELFEIDPRETIAVGDYNNDISMIKAAGTGYAVQNAVSDAKAVADRITVSNEEHAIAKIIEDIEKHGILNT